MDSIVDTFFPLIDFIESESDDIDAFLSDPLRDFRKHINPSKISVNEATNIDNKARHKPRFTAFLNRHVSPSIILQINAIIPVFPSEKNDINKPSATTTLALQARRRMDDKLYDRGKMLKRIAITRKVITGISRLLLPKMDVMNGLRKRFRHELKAISVVEAGQRHDISIYLGDLQGKAFLCLLRFS